jgi:ribosomal protein S18 acetylase RimI-like enzyme
MKPVLRLRAAQVDDAPFAASMLRLSMGSLADHLFGRKPGNIEKLLEKLFARDAGRFGYKHAFIAAFENTSVGLLVASRGDKVNRLNLETIPHLMAVLGPAKAVGFIWRVVMLPGGKEAEDDELYISNLGIIPSMQGRFFGTHMLAHAEKLAQDRNLAKCSLIVGWHNTSARRLYERVGYQVVETVKDEGKHNGYYRMVKVL